MGTMQYESPAYCRPAAPYLDRPSSSGLRDVLELILDKGLVIDIYVRVSLVGIELLTIDARIVVASIDTYLRFAEAVNRLDLTRTETRGLPELMDQMGERGAKSRTKGVVEGVREKVEDILPGHEQEEAEEPRTRPRRREREP